ncbi:MAG: hypothetical protein CSB55_05565 [Candidatus Cloacimonadota bacterium]|nr:MAG: hypothetical protein CSB55_05565 [Candidatus Cloacimonadota bacterium]
MKSKKRLYKLLSFLAFLVLCAGNTILYYKLGKAIAIGVLLEVFALYSLVKIEIKQIRSKDENQES